MAHDPENRHEEVIRQFYRFLSAFLTLGDATVEHPLAVGVIEWEAFAYSPSERRRISLQHSEDQPVLGELRDEGDVHL